MFNQLKLIFKLGKEGPEARIAISVLESNHQMTTKANSRGDFEVEMVAAEQQKTFKYLAIEGWKSLPSYIK